METLELADGGILLYDDAFLPPDLADRYFVELRDTSALEQKKAAFGHLQPRLTASYGDEGVTYFYSGTENKALPWTPTLLEIKRKIEAVRGRYNSSMLFTEARTNSLGVMYKAIIVTSDESERRIMSNLLTTGLLARRRPLDPIALVRRDVQEVAGLHFDRLRLALFLPVAKIIAS